MQIHRTSYLVQHANTQNFISCTACKYTELHILYSIQIHRTSYLVQHANTQNFLSCTAYKYTELHILYSMQIHRTSYHVQHANIQLLSIYILHHTLEKNLIVRNVKVHTENHLYTIWVMQ